MTEQPKSECKCFDCNLPELETLSYEPPKSSRATEDNLTPIIEPKTKVENSEVVGQHFEQPKFTGHCPNCGQDWKTHEHSCKDNRANIPEQPNQNLMSTI